MNVFGGADGIRTHYLLTASQTLSQLSYSPMLITCYFDRLIQDGPGALYCPVGTRYLPDANRDALPTELQPHAEYLLLQPSNQDGLRSSTPPGGNPLSPRC
jgi:hypothetical protein